MHTLLIIFMYIIIKITKPSLTLYVRLEKGYIHNFTFNLTSNKLLYYIFPNRVFIRIFFKTEYHFLMTVGKLIVEDVT